MRKKKLEKEQGDHIENHYPHAENGMYRNSNQIQNMRIISSTFCMNIAGPVSVTRVHGYSDTNAMYC
jgi:hypothetical protein